MVTFLCARCPFTLALITELRKSKDADQTILSYRKRKKEVPHFSNKETTQAPKLTITKVPQPKFHRITYYGRCILFSIKCDH